MHHFLQCICGWALNNRALKKIAVKSAPKAIEMLLAELMGGVAMGNSNVDVYY
jgi:hypothetical protein